MGSRGYPDAHASDGAQFLSLQYVERLGTISQTFATQPGQTYRVEFDQWEMTKVAGGVNPPQTFTLTAAAPGVSQDFSITTAGLFSADRAKRELTRGRATRSISLLMARHPR